MVTFIANIFKKLQAFWLRIFSGWYPAVKVAGGIHIYPLQISAFAHSLFQIRQNRELALKSRVFRRAKPPP